MLAEECGHLAPPAKCKSLRIDAVSLGLYFKGT